MGVAGLAELRHAESDDLLHGFASGLEIVTGIELFGRLPEDLANGAGDGEAAVGIDVDLADAVLNAELNFFDGDAPGFLKVTAVLVDYVLEIFGNGGAMPCITR